MPLSFIFKLVIHFLKQKAIPFCFLLPKHAHIHDRPKMTHICRIIQIRPITQQVIQMSFIEINTKKQFKLHIHTTVSSAL
jgi:hypothetical protein